MPDHLPIHEELHRLILRKRWIRWSQRNYKFGDYMLYAGGKIGGRHVMLSMRLTMAKPTYEQRKSEEKVECEF
jgi:hypothetical protein